MTGTSTDKQHFLRNGFAKVDGLISMEAVEHLRGLYDALLNDRELTQGLRSDLGGGNGEEKVEKITQIMRPSLVVPQLQQSIAYARALAWAKETLGEDMELDFDMLINKAPHTNTPTPWHQAGSRWMRCMPTMAVCGLCRVKTTRLTSESTDPPPPAGHWSARQMSQKQSACRSAREAALFTMATPCTTAVATRPTASAGHSSSISDPRR